MTSLNFNLVGSSGLQVGLPELQGSRVWALTMLKGLESLATGHFSYPEACGALNPELKILNLELLQSVGVAKVARVFAPCSSSLVPGEVQSFCKDGGGLCSLGSRVKV